MEPELKSNKMEIVKNLILRTFSFLEDQYFYIPVYKVEEDNLFIESLEIEYVNKFKRRTIDISYTNGNIHNELRHTFTASITRLPYVSVEDFFSLDNYIKSKGRKLSTSFVNDFNLAKAENILAQIATIIKEDAWGIINGNEWLGTYYPRKD